MRMLFAVVEGRKSVHFWLRAGKNEYSNLTDTKQRLIANAMLLNSNDALVIMTNMKKENSQFKKNWRWKEKNDARWNDKLMFFVRGLISSTHVTEKTHRAEVIFSKPWFPFLGLDLLVVPSQTVAKNFSWLQDCCHNFLIGFPSLQMVLKKTNSS